MLYLNYKKIVYTLNQFPAKLNNKYKNKVQNFKKDLEDE